jgi:hypothetical protein
VTGIVSFGLEPEVWAKAGEQTTTTVAKPIAKILHLMIWRTLNAGSRNSNTESNRGREAGLQGHAYRVSLEERGDYFY